MFDNMLFVNFSKTCVPLFYLPLVENFDAIPLYNWVQHVLACLNKNLCNASMEKAKQVEGCFLLLHVNQLNNSFCIAKMFKKVTNHLHVFYTIMVLEASSLIIFFI